MKQILGMLAIGTAVLTLFGTAPSFAAVENNLGNSRDRFSSEVENNCGSGNHRGHDHSGRRRAGTTNNPRSN